MKKRYMIRFVITSLILCFFTGCQDQVQSLNSITLVETIPEQEPIAVPSITIDVQPFNDISQKDVEYVVAALKKVYPNIILNKTIPLPKQAYYEPRKRYRADSIIDFLSSKTTEGHVTIGLTTKDISTTSGKYKDWGVMGLGFQPGNACVVSTFRLSKTNTLEEFFKVSIHELGHTQGLPHCPNKGCFMQDAEGKNKTSDEHEFL